MVNLTYFSFVVDINSFEIFFMEINVINKFRNLLNFFISLLILYFLALALYGIFSLNVGKTSCTIDIFELHYI